MHFSKLRLVGFKSFVDPTELVIEPGLTGIVGPNGCGKSNLVEALSWAMGETSAKRMRGGEMDDVIFGGTDVRPARNLAEVTLWLDNSRHDAPKPYDAYDEIEVVRRIERGDGSGYRVNGKEVRARDVQLLFADAATGAQSPAIVSQGRVGAIINARPVDRRALIEEAAGITGLHSRRHEAELRLKAAEANLVRLEDVLTTLAAQLDGLKKQARQAARYRRLSDHIRRAEAVVLHLRWQAARAEHAAAEEQLAAAELAVADRTAAALAAERAREAAATALPPLRQSEAAAAAELQRLVLARQALEDEERRIAAAREAAEQRLVQLAADIAREDELAADARDRARAARRRAPGDRRRASARGRGAGSGGVRARRCQRRGGRARSGTRPTHRGDRHDRGTAQHAARTPRRGRASGRSVSPGARPMSRASAPRSRPRASPPNAPLPPRKRFAPPKPSSRPAAPPPRRQRRNCAPPRRRRPKRARRSKQAERNRAKLRAEAQALAELLAATERPALCPDPRPHPGGAGIRGGARRGARRRSHRAARRSGADALARSAGLRLRRWRCRKAWRRSPPR